jgi:hypothetical protein
MTLFLLYLLFFFFFQFHYVEFLFRGNNSMGLRIKYLSFIKKYFFTYSFMLYYCFIIKTSSTLLTLIQIIILLVYRFLSSKIYFPQFLNWNLIYWIYIIHYFLLWWYIWLICFLLLFLFRLSKRFFVLRWNSIHIHAWISMFCHFLRLYMWLKYFSIILILILIIIKRKLNQYIKNLNLNYI